MAGDWIKMRSNLRRHPKVVRLASASNADRLRVVGGLHAVWCLFDEHSEDGRLYGYTPSAIDEEIGWPGFCDLLIAIGWVESDGNDGLFLPDFDTHNGASAKRRAQEADRKRADRAAQSGLPQDGGNASASGADKKRTREEKRREEIEDTPQPPQAGEAGAVCKAIRGKGVTDVSPSHPELLALIAKGVSIEAFEAAATTCANSKPPKGMAYLLAIVKRQLSEAASIAAGPAAVSAAVDPDSRSAIEAEGEAKGFGRWNEAGEQWHVYKSRVRGNKQPGLSLGDLAGMAQQRQGAH
jgi:hypothetical protein